MYFVVPQVQWHGFYFSTSCVCHQYPSIDFVAYCDLLIRCYMEEERFPDGTEFALTGLDVLEKVIQIICVIYVDQ